MFVTAGFIVGFDNEKAAIAEPMIDLIEEAAIPVAMVGLLYALPNTQLDAPARQGRAGCTSCPNMRAGPVTATSAPTGCNFDTLRPRREILERLPSACWTGCTIPVAFAGRLRRLVRHARPLQPRRRQLRRRRHAQDSAASSMLYKHHDRAARGARAVLRGRFVAWSARPIPARCARSSAMMAIYLHLGPFSRTSSPRSTAASPRSMRARSPPPTRSQLVSVRPCSA